MKTKIQTQPNTPQSPKAGWNVGSKTPVEQNDVLHLKNLLVPTDFSDTAAKALNHAIAMAGQFGAKIDLIHVVLPPKDFMGTMPLSAEWDKGVIQGVKTRLDGLAEDKIDELIPVNTVVQVGQPDERICEMAKDTKADLIVISTHGYTGLKHVCLGSTAERVVRHAPCSVLVVRGREADDASTEFKPKRILVPMDFSEHATQALNYAVGIAREFQAEVQLLHVVPIRYGVGEYDTMDYRMLELESHEAAEKELAKLVKSLSSRHIAAQTEVCHGRPATEITERAKDLKSDLIVISTHGRTGWDRALLGSTTEEVVRHASIPVLVVRKK